MKFSIIIPTYNNKVLLKNTLEALNNQIGYSFGDYEVIVVDDGSSDNTEDYIQGINRNYTLKYYYLERCADSCRSRTRNHGLKNACGKFIVFIDSDIIVKNDYLHQVNRCFSINEDIFLIGNRLFLDDIVEYKNIVDGTVFKKYNFINDQYHLLEYRYFLYNVASFNANTLMCPWTQTYTCNLVAPKKWLDKIGGFDENFIEWGIEDLEIGYSLSKVGLQMVINSKLEVFHQYHGPRNDLIIETKKLAGYEKNIDYFIEKHPEALKMRPKIAHNFLLGGVSSRKISMELPKEKYELEFRDKRKLPDVKAKLLELIQMDNIKPILYDYVEDTDLDIWIQLLKNSNSVIHYFPMSRWVDVNKMQVFIDNEKELQKVRN